MRKTTLLVTCAALLAAGACGKKKEEAKQQPVARPEPAPPAKPPEPPPPPPKPAKLEGAALAQRMIDCHGAFSAGDAAKLKDCYTGGAASRWLDSAAPEVKGADAIVKGAMDLRGGFPDAKSVPQLVLVNGRNVAAVLWFSATNTGTFMGMPPTSKKVGYLMLHMANFDDVNQITEEWWVMDDATIARQLGMLPPEAGPGRPVLDKGQDGAPVVVVATGSDVEQGNLAAFARGVESFNKHDLKAIMADWTDDAIESDLVAPADTVGKKEIEKGTKMFLGGFPDGTVTPRNVWAAGDYVIAVSSFTGTNKGDMGPMKKTNKPVSMTVAELNKFEAGKVKQLWRFWNSTGMMTQLGLMPDPSKAAPPGGAPAGGAGK